MIASEREVVVSVTGGTDVRLAPSIGYLAWVLLPLLERMGVAAQLEVLRHGYYPRGGGKCGFGLFPARCSPSCSTNRVG